MSVLLSFDADVHEKNKGYPGVPIAVFYFFSEETVKATRTSIFLGPLKLKVREGFREVFFLISLKRYHLGEASNNFFFFTCKKTK